MLLLPTDRIQAVKRHIMTTARQSHEEKTEELVLDAVLGEGTFGKVFRGYWRGTLVAVKVMRLPGNLSGKEKRDRMAVMETAISSSLSHPNVVQTYKYMLEEVEPMASVVQGRR